MVILDDKASDTDKESYQGFVESYDGIEKTLTILQQSFEVSHPDHLTQDITVMVPEDAETFTDFIRLQDRTSDATYQLTDNGAIVTERLATLFEIELGDSITITDSDNQSYEIEIVEITENYTGHY